MSASREPTLTPTERRLSRTFKNNDLINRDPLQALFRHGGYAPVPASEADIQNSVPSATNPSSEPATSLKDLPMAGDCVAVPVAAPLTASPPASSHAAVQNTTEAPAAARLSGRNMHVPASVIKKIPISSAESSSPVGAPGRSGKGFPSRASPSSSAAHLDSASSSGTHLSLRTSAPELSDPAHPVHPPPALNAHAARIPRRNPSPQGRVRSGTFHFVDPSPPLVVQANSATPRSSSLRKRLDPTEVLEIARAAIQPSADVKDKDKAKDNKEKEKLKLEKKARKEARAAKRLLKEEKRKRKAEAKAKLAADAAVAELVKEREREEAAKAEVARLEKEKQEKERLEKERLEKERLEKERLEKERLEKEKEEKERAKVSELVAHPQKEKKAKKLKKDKKDKKATKEKKAKKKKKKKATKEEERSRKDAVEQKAATSSAAPVSASKDAALAPSLSGAPGRSTSPRTAASSSVRVSSSRLRTDPSPRQSHALLPRADPSPQAPQSPISSPLPSSSLRLSSPGRSQPRSGAPSSSANANAASSPGRSQAASPSSPLVASPEPGLVTPPTRGANSRLRRTPSDLSARRRQRRRAQENQRLAVKAYGNGEVPRAKSAPVVPPVSKAALVSPTRSASGGVAAPARHTNRPIVQLKESSGLSPPRQSIAAPWEGLRRELAAEGLAPRRSTQPKPRPSTAQVVPLHAKSASVGTLTKPPREAPGQKDREARRTRAGNRNSSPQPQHTQPPQQQRGRQRAVATSDNRDNRRSVHTLIDIAKLKISAT